MTPRHPRRPGGRRHRRARRRRASSTTAASSRSARTSTATRVLDAGGCVVAPGLVDLHSHLRQPGREEAETVETGTPVRGARRVHRGRRHAEHHAGHRQRRGGPRGAGPRGQGALRRPPRRPPSPSAGPASSSGADGRAGRARRADLHRRRLRRAGQPADAPGDGVRGRAPQRVVLAQHCEDAALCGGGHMHEGRWSAAARHRRPAGRGRGADGRPRPGARPAHRRHRPHAAPLDRRLASSSCGRPGPRASG